MDGRRCVCYFSSHMETNVEQTVAPAERPPMPETRELSALEKAVESGDVAPIIEGIEQDAIVEAKTFSKNVDPETMAQADAIEAQIVARSGEAKAEIAKVTGESQIIAEAEAEMTAMHEEAMVDTGWEDIHAEAMKKSPAVIARELLQRRPAKPVEAPAVVATRLVSIGDVSSKVAKRMTPEDVAAVSARKEIAIGGEKGVAVTAEGVSGIQVEKNPSDEEPELDAREATSEEKAEVEAAVEEEKETKKGEARTEEKEMEGAETKFTGLFGKADALFAAGDSQGLEKLAAESDATIDHEVEKLAAWKSAHPNPEQYSKEMAVGFALWKASVEIAMARRERIEAQAELLNLKKRQEAETDPAKKAELGIDIDAKAGEIVSLEGEINVKVQEMEQLRSEFRAAKQEQPKEEEEEKEKREQEEKPEVAPPDIKGAVIRTGEKIIDLAAGTINGFIDMAMTGDIGKILTDVSKWLEKSGAERKNKRDEERRKKDEAERKRKDLSAKREEVLRKREEEDRRHAEEVAEVEQREKEAKEAEAKKAGEETKKAV